VLAVIRTGLSKPNYYRSDNTEMGVIFGFIDEGGHRMNEVHYVCKHLPALKPYKGSSNHNADPLKRGQSGIHFMGNTRHWSDLVGNHMESDAWHLPKDVGQDYLAQVVNQWVDEQVDPRGNKKYVWMSGSNDHFRSCENYVLAAAYALGLPEKLNDPTTTDKIKQAAQTYANRLKTVQDTVEQPKQTAQTAPGGIQNRLRNRRYNSNPYRRRF